MLKFINFLLRFAKVELVALPYIQKDLRESAKLITGQVAEMDGSGEFKRAQALRALMNRHPELGEGDLALAIELALL